MSWVRNIRYQNNPKKSAKKKVTSKVHEKNAVGLSQVEIVVLTPSKSESEIVFKCPWCLG